MNTTFNKIIGLTLVLGLFLACGNKPKNTQAEKDYQRAARYFVADESFSPILNEELDIFRYQNILDTLEVQYTNEQEAVKKLMKLETWLAFTTRDLTKNERQSLEDRKYLPRTIPVAYDGLAIIVNNSNPDTCITVKDFKRILRGEASQWKQLYPSSKLGEIDVVFDNPLSSTVRWCVDSLLSGKEFSAPNIGAVKTSAAVIDYVERHPGALGIIGSNWLNDSRDTTNVTFKKNITVMKVSRMDTATAENSWRPYQYYIYNGNYPLIRTIYALLNEPRNGLPTSFAHFVRLPKGQMIIHRAGLLTIQAGMNVRQVIVNGNYND
ncbi:MAG: substrate-binding domain-containing protein [Prevotella sp.]|nr:substrate-binding domain-containing protein [Prevotella sp.]